MTAQQIHQRVARALAITSFPEWDSPDGSGPSDSLVYMNHDPSQAPLWALSPIDDLESAEVILDPVMAAELIKSHLARWLLARSFQVQVSIRAGQTTWRLVDCLSPSDGGGDRIDADYPIGDDELVVMCQSVEVLSRP